MDVYKILRNCGKFYNGNMRRRLETRMKEHQDASREGLLKKLGIAEHSWENGYPIKWAEASVTDHARISGELLVEALHTWLTSQNERSNKDESVELLKFWMASILLTCSQ